jgi:hypothetical protein
MLREKPRLSERNATWSCQASVAKRSLRCSPVIVFNSVPPTYRGSVVEELFSSLKFGEEDMSYILQ